MFGRKRRFIDDGLTPDQRKKSGTIYLGVGAVAWISFALVFGSIKNAREAEAANYADGAAQCANRLAGLGGQATVVGDRVIWRKAGDAMAGEPRVGEASVVAASCPGWTMASACFGESCDGGHPYSIVLRRHAPLQ